MNMSEELERLAKLKEAGVLTPEEFEKAKQRVLAGDGIGTPVEKPDSDSLGSAANKYVNFEITMKTVGFVVGLLFFLFFFLPMACSMQRRFNDFPGPGGIKLQLSPNP